MSNKSMRPNEYKHILQGEPVTTYDNIHGNVTTKYYNANNEHIGYFVKALNSRTKAYLFNQIKTSARNTYHKTKLDAIIADLKELKYDSQAFNCAIHNNAIDKAIEVIKQRLKP